MRFRQPQKKSRAPSGRAAPARAPVHGDPASAAGNRAVERELTGEGRPLPASTRAEMESALGGSFKDVRVHTGPEAGRAAREQGATAFTRGADIVFDRGQYNPGTPGGDALIAHELAHVMQQRGATTAGKHSAALEADATKAAARGMSGIFGGMRARLAGAGPVLRSGLAVQSCSCAGAQKVGKGRAGGKGVEQKGPDPLAAEKESLAKEFGLSRVADSEEAKWEAAELTKARRTLAKLPPDAKAAIQGVALVRVARPNCPGGDPAGCFRQSVNPTTGDREDVIEIGNDAFAQDKDFEDKDSSVKSTRFDASGAEITSLPSEDVLLHEVGHAVESARQREAVSTRFKADLAVTPKQDALKSAVAAFVDALPSVAGITNASAAELAYHSALVAVSVKLEEVRKKAVEADDEPDAKKLKDTGDAIQKLKPGVQKAIRGRDEKKAKLPASSAAPQPAVETAQNRALAAIDGMVKAFKDRLAAQQKLEAARAAEAKEQAKVPGGDGKIDASRRLAEVVAIVHIKKIDIKNNGALGKYPKDNWPDHPEELYADLFQMSITEPGGLEVFDKDIAAYFKNPIGVKDAALKKKVDSWIAAQKK